LLSTLVPGSVVEPINPFQGVPKIRSPEEERLGLQPRLIIIIIIIIIAELSPSCSV
jgi:hypothetical protein